MLWEAPQRSGPGSEVSTQGRVLGFGFLGSVSVL